MKKIIKVEIDLDEIFDSGYCDCDNCIHCEQINTNYEYQEYEWFCEKSKGKRIEDLENCPLGLEMPIENSYFRDLDINLIEE